MIICTLRTAYGGCSGSACSSGRMTNTSCKPTIMYPHRAQVVVISSVDGELRDRIHELIHSPIEADDFKAFIKRAIRETCRERYKDTFDFRSDV